MFRCHLVGPVACLAALATCFTQPVHAGDSASEWPRFRGPSANGIYSGGELPTRWSHDSGIAWKIQLPGAGSSSPTVAGGHIYVTCYSGYAVPGESRGDLSNLKRHLLAIDPRDGSIIWKKAIPARLPESEHVRDHGYAASTPVADEDRVYVFFGKTGVFAFSHDGKDLWRAPVGDGTHGWGSGASLVLDGDLLFVNASVESQSLIALHKKSGRLKWRVPGIREAWNTPLVVEGRGRRKELLIAMPKKVVAFEPRTGKPLWTCDTDITWYIVPSIIADRGVAYVLGGRSGVAAVAVRTGGRGNVTRSHRLWLSSKGSNVSSPILHDGHLYWVHDQQGIAYCADPRSGRILYQERLPRGGQVYASPLLAEDRIYYLNRRGVTFVVAASPKFELIAQNDLQDGTRFDASPVPCGNRILIRSNRFLYCIGQE